MNVRATRGPHSASSPGLDFEVKITGMRTVDERNAEGFANAIDVDALPDVVDLTDDSSSPLPPVLSKKENAPPPNQLPQLEAPVAKDAAEEVRTTTVVVAVEIDPAEGGGLDDDVGEAVQNQEVMETTVASNPMPADSPPPPSSSPPPPPPRPPPKPRLRPNTEDRRRSSELRQQLAAALKSAAAANELAEKESKARAAAEEKARKASVAAAEATASANAAKKAAAGQKTAKEAAEAEAKKAAKKVATAAEKQRQAEARAAAAAMAAASMAARAVAAASAEAAAVAKAEVAANATATATAMAPATAPGSWWPMAADANFLLLPSSPDERRRVETTFLASCGFASRFGRYPHYEPAFRLLPARLGVEVVNIQRIQNVSLWQAYAAKRDEIMRREKASDEVVMRRFERLTLYHGTDQPTAIKIAQHGFNRSYSFGGANGARLGMGSYFAASECTHPLTLLRPLPASTPHCTSDHAC